MWAYQYTSPTPEELALRRQQLNAAGKAGLMPFLLLIPAFLYRLARKHITPQPTRKDRSQPPTPLQLWLRRITWILNTTYLPEFGPLHIQLIGLAHFAFLLFLTFHNTGNDYMHLTKALGHVAVSQLPLQYLLAFKSHDSPFRWATGLTHERLNAYHRLMGRMVHVLLASHAVLYLKFFVDKGLLSKRIKDWDVRLGVMAFWSFNILGLLALPVVRKKAYHALFYRSHVVLTAVVLVVLWFHVPYTRSYVGVAALFWLANGMMRRSQTMACTGQETVDTGDGLLQVNLRVAETRSLKSWVPGQHVYLRIKDSRAVLDRKNPFTVVEVDHDTQKVNLVVRKLAGTTAMLSSLAQSQWSPRLGVEGPYGEASEYLPALLSAGKSAGQILLVAGGVGATYTFPIYLALLRTRGDSVGLKMLWLVKQVEDVEWATKMLGSTREGVDIDIFVTKVSSRKDVSKFEGAGIKIQHTGKRPDLGTVLEPLLAAKEESEALMGDEGKQSPRQLKKNYNALTVMVCGPPELSQRLRREVGKHVLGYGRDVTWYEEQFGFGGSSTSR